MKRFLFLATVLFLGCLNASEPKESDNLKRNRIVDNQADPKIEWTLTDKPGVWALFLNGSKIQTGCYEPKTKTYHRLAGGNFFPEPPPDFLDLTVFDKIDENGDLKPLSDKEFKDLKKKLRDSIDKKKTPEPTKAGEIPEAGKGEAAGELPAPSTFQNFGLNLSGNFDEQESFRYMGKPIDREKAFQALEFGDIEGKQDPDQLTDDSSKFRLTVIGPDKLRKSAVSSLKANPRWKEIESETILKDYPQNHWAITGKGFATQPAQVTYHLTDAEGVSIYEGSDPEGVFDGLRRKKKGGWDIDWNSWSLGINPWTWAPTIGFSTFHLSGELVLIVLAALIAIVAMKNKRQPPKFP